MAISLGFLGRGTSLVTRGPHRVVLAGVHVIASGFGGALLGLAAAVVGDLSHATGKPYIAGVIIAGLLGLEALRRTRRLGLRRQVPRRWPRWMPVSAGYVAWGAMLGSGVLTLIAYTSLIGVVALELISTVTGGLVLGSVFGLAREAPAVLALVRPGGSTFNPSSVMAVLPRLQAVAKRLNVTWLFAAAATVAVVGWRGTWPL
jgi:hypothetical protein